MMKNLSLIIAQDNESAKRFRQLGAHSAQIRVAGSLKWVINTPKLNNDNNDVKKAEIVNDGADLDLDLDLDLALDLEIVMLKLLINSLSI